MTYRDDHDAALARIDALELEKHRLVAEVAKLREPSQPTETADLDRSTNRFVLALVGVGALFATAVITRLISTPDEQPDPTERFEARLTAVARAPLATCAFAIAQNPHLNAILTDPHGDVPASVDPIKAMVAPCRNDLLVYRNSGIIDPDEHRAIERWLGAEDELAGAIARIVIYYGNEPYLLDGYESAPQLWTEYDRAVAHREVAVADWRRTE